MAMRDSLPAVLPATGVAALVRRIVGLPLGVSFAGLWLMVMVVTALGADFMLP